jgi:hypothetical protein
VVVTAVFGSATSTNGLQQSITMTLAGGTASVVVGGDYFGDMSVQLFGWESLAYVEWWGN